MKWNSGQPIRDGRYLCAVKNCSYPVLLYWNCLMGGSGFWSDKDGIATKDTNYDVIYYMNLGDIPMPEGCNDR